MEKRALGRSGLLVAPLCFGGNVFGWTADEKMSFALLDGFVAAGFDFIDTAEKLFGLGEGVRRRRERDRAGPLVQGAARGTA